jgi:hypothetical protein
MRSHDSLFREFATELRFPGYFGANWPALADCLGDLLWFEELPHMLLVIEDWPSVLADAPIDLPVLTRILNDTAADWARLGYDGTGANPVAFNTVLLT